MPQGLKQGRVAVVGAGVVGLAVARELASRGWEVTLLDKGQPGQEASSAAAGMLVPHLEFHDQPRLLALGEEALSLYPAFVEALEAQTQTCVDLRLDGVLSPLPPEAKTTIPQAAEHLRGSDLHAVDASLSESVLEGLYFPENGSVDNRALVQALLVSCTILGVKILGATAVDEIILEGGRVGGVRSGEREFPAEVVVNCAGAWAEQLPVPDSRVRVRPIKGQMLRLDANDRTPRVVIFSDRVYLVPRSDGRVIVGTTVEDKGYDKEVEAAVVARLLRETFALYPGLRTARFADAWAGLRPKGESEVPLVGPDGPPGYFVAVGHFRNGILFAPLTARALTDCIEQRSSSLCFSS